MLAQKRVLITGSTGGLGWAIANEFAAKGCAIFLHGLATGLELEQLSQRLTQKYNVPVLTSNADLTRQNDVMGLVEDALSQWRGLDILVNNAGIQYVSAVADFPAEKWDQVVAVNLHAAFYMARMFLPSMKQQKWGRIINIASAHGLVASPFKSAYVASKHALVGLTKVVALEAANDGITCNAICPGWVRTDLVEKQIQARAKQEQKNPEDIAMDLLTEKHPQHQFVQAEDVAKLAVYLCGDAARSITGAALPIDGAWTAQ